MYEAVEQKIAAFKANRHRIRLLNNEKKKQARGVEFMVQAIKDLDFRRCIEVAETCGVSIDFETEDGVTPLVAASEENSTSSNHIFMLNDDGRPCHAVEYLLDRTMNRPGIDVEVKCGHTPLIRACSMSRYNVVIALVERGAGIDKVNMYGKTALHYATNVGSGECVRVLVESGADLTIKDNEGMTAYDVAQEMGFLSIMKLLSQMATGFIGKVKVVKGSIQEKVSCPLGCAKIMYKHDVAEHVAKCELRVVECPNDCKERLIQARELDAHIRESCIRRRGICRFCRATYEIRFEEAHLADS
jgi:hypothetical protein